VSWIGVDLDGTLAHYEGFVAADVIGEPIPAMVARVKAWLAGGQEVRIFTARACSMGGERPTAPFMRACREWCVKHIGQELPITHKKDHHMIALWDDRCVTVERNTGRILTTPPTSTADPAGEGRRIGPMSPETRAKLVEAKKTLHPHVSLNGETFPNQPSLALVAIIDALLDVFPAASESVERAKARGEGVTP